MSQHLEPTREYVDTNKTTLPMSYTKVLEFLESTQGKSRSEITQLARITWNDLESLDDMFTNIYKHVSSRTLRSRLTRIKKCLSPPDNETGDKQTDTESLAEEMTTDDRYEDDFISPASKNGKSTSEY
ncbi:hypothetical protein QAD02_013196 [Eretmocerus hayati]|uniref:Uncharacterized protein n=1 Tax=Eretmocerus hayati TaxID=131215 RepID=A0ACC2P1H4_9HYME|nr:hypothetical protein QAD02_013196 [Eretmocerus hayati]